MKILACFLNIRSFRIALVTGFIAAFVVSVFFLFYITEVNSLFLPIFLEAINWNNTLTTFMLTFVIATMVVSALTIMQLFKKTRNIIQNP